MNTALRIVQVVPTYLPATQFGGVVFAVHGLARHLVQCGHVVDVVTTNGGLTRDSAYQRIRTTDLDGVRVHYVPVGVGARIYRAPGFQQVLADLLPTADVLHLHSVFLWPTLVAARAARRAGIPYIVTPHGMLDRTLIKMRGALRKRAWISAFERTTLTRADAVQVTSQYEHTELAALGLDFGKTVVLPYGIDVTPGRAPATARDADTVLFLGRLDPKKGCDVLIAAMAEIPDARLVFAGAGEPAYVEHLRGLVTRAGMTERVTFLGEVDAAGRDHWLDRAVCMVLPSQSENFALVVGEAMARGCPVVVSDAVGLAAAVREAGAGHVCEAEPAAVATCIQSLRASAETRARMGERGRAYVAAHLQWDGVGPRFIDLYNLLTSDADHPGSGADQQPPESGKESGKDSGKASGETHAV